MTETVSLPVGDGYFLVTASKKMRPVLVAIEKLCDVDVSVLVEGETGTGKELVARALHGMGRRKHKPFVAVNCAAIPDTLLESELFGYEKGAFTDARRSYVGKVERADGGTLLLDEIGDMSLPLQAKMLRVLQNKKVERLGSAESVSVDVRVVCTTNQDIWQMVQQGQFRGDLYWRIAVMQVRIPPLRARRKDIIPLTHHLLQRFCRQMGRVPPAVSECALRALCEYDWPGNVRELENVLQRALIYTNGSHQLEAKHIVIRQLYLGF